MSKHLDLSKEANLIPYDSKKTLLLSLPETEIHKLLYGLFNKLGNQIRAEITHGSAEHGVDLVVKQPDALGDQFIGVIVEFGNKKGDLTGDTDGVIDEILSHSRQAMEMPCLLRELKAGAVHLNQLWIFVVGRLTKPASERIEYQLKDAKRIFALEAIIEMFEKYYPEVFFDVTLATFVDQMLEKFEDLNIQKTIKSNYITPRVWKWEKANDLTEAMVSSMVFSKKMPFVKLEELVEAGGQLIITGEPGIGKTSALLKIGTDMLRKNFMRKAKKPDSNLEIPIIIKAKELVEKDIDVIYAETLNTSELRDKISIKTLMVDGLDEVKVDKRKSCVEKAKQFSTKYKCGFVITCRKVQMLTTILSPFERYELLPLESEQAVMFVEKTLQDKKLLEVLKDGIQHDELKLKLTPMSLELLIQVANEEREVPASLAEIYDRYTELTCGKHDQGKGIESVFEYQIKKRFLADLAYDLFFLKEKIHIPRKELDDFIDSYALTYGWEASKLQHFVAEIERSNLLKLDDEVSFSHRSFLDYFIALRIHINKLKYPDLTNEIVKIYFNDLWSEVAFYYIGIERRIEPELIDAIENFPNEGLDICMYKVLIGRLLQAGWYTPSKEKVRAINVGLNSVENVRTFADEMLSIQKLKLPALLSDFFCMLFGEYSYGSRTMLKESMQVSTELSKKNDALSVRNALFLMWAQRNRLDKTFKDDLSNKSLATLSAIETQHNLSLRNKLTCLFMLLQIENENKPLLASIKRKINRVREVYPDEFNRLLPNKRGTIRFLIPKQTHRFK